MKFNSIEELVKYCGDLNTPIEQIDIIINAPHNITETTNKLHTPVNSIDLYFTTTPYIDGDNKLLVDNIEYINEGLLSFTFGDTVLTMLHTDGNVYLPTNFGLRKFKLTEDSTEFRDSVRCMFTP